MLMGDWPPLFNTFGAFPYYHMKVQYFRALVWVCPGGFLIPQPFPISQVYPGEAVSPVGPGLGGSTQFTTEMVEITHGSKASWMELRETTMNCQLHLSKTKYLRLEAWTTPVVLHYPEEELLTPFKRAYAVVGQEGNSYKFSAQIPVVQEPIELEPMVKYDDTYLCTGIVLGGFRDRNYPLVVEYPLLLVAKKGYFWERIGIAYLREVSKVFPLYIDPLHPYLNHLRERRLFEEWMRYHLPLHRQVIYLG
ncbi:hypothetical protein N431DRAFT_435565 [Stipitochalara longipes BDJ]|nr:hypothetical protein N431DRAFT_435565 [Stipitochalara longipes BDJ]